MLTEIGNFRYPSTFEGARTTCRGGGGRDFIVRSLCAFIVGRSAPTASSFATRLTFI